MITSYRKYNKEHKDDPLDTEMLGIPGNKCPIFIVEHLSPELKELHAAARQTAKKLSYKYVWTSYGRIFMRKDHESPKIHIKINSDLEKLGKPVDSP